MKPYGFVYLTTNTENGKKYIGQASYRRSLRSTYIGSGKAIKRAIKKYGAHAFVRETVFEAFTKDDLDWAERTIIADQDAVKSELFYNIAPGGRASLGFTGKTHSLQRNQALSEAMLNNHPTAAKINIDGETYQGFQRAADTLGCTTRKIGVYLKTGVHPRDQVHKLNGYKRGVQVSARTTWILTSTNGHSENVVSLKHWCLEHNVPYAIRDHQGSLYHGWILTRPSLQP
jgi:hypothetical protein